MTCQLTLGPRRARKFMCLMSPDTKLLVIDEPTSAMDLEGEFKLFEALRRVRSGWTLVIHRSGAATSRAMCMYDDMLLESDTHKLPVERNGVYSKLYNIQAHVLP
ncbi:uncharacterized protein PHACADRAFT_142711 [Phanerochaete carnosa HHB-10118-sp]|uniref:ABC transporter domain-containing protein n=1 Tax=Phanerochaete carnosa (strain HHB-10118-sp) TaxID=650164 RepID=K5UXV8_PHACS|nr:uncharacterized protein PHACADRAFT_142711 [Phanerochaete carnosa HHB-10118-sp]EKM54931.1 hypothetical protein PHACADRAFT_142711 [Phanerochaete carnosa HHB-10118-sp]